MLNAPDQDVRDHALRNGQVLLSKDRDFADRAVARSPAPRSVWPRPGNRDMATLLVWLEDAWPRIVENLDSGARVVEAGR
jgi:predicted nuclease of predicted toxin-antitoxin system